MYIKILQNRSLPKHMGQGRYRENCCSAERAHSFCLDHCIIKLRENIVSVTLLSVLVSPGQSSYCFDRSVIWIYSVPSTALCSVCGVQQIHFSVLILCSLSITLTFPEEERFELCSVVVFSSLFAMWIGLSFSNWYVEITNHFSWSKGMCLISPLSCRSNQSFSQMGSH